jgi:hypothetical protein
MTYYTIGHIPGIYHGYLTSTDSRCENLNADSKPAAECSWTNQGKCSFFTRSCSSSFDQQTFQKKNEQFPWSRFAAAGPAQPDPLHFATGLLAFSTWERFVGLFFGPGDYIPRHMAASSDSDAARRARDPGRDRSGRRAVTVFAKKSATCFVGRYQKRSSMKAWKPVPINFFPWCPRSSFRS